MKNLTILALGLAIVLACGSAGATLVDLTGATARTVWDKDGNNYDATSWYRNATLGDPIAEDNEVEPPNMVPDDTWDLEGFMVKGDYLYMIGTYNFDGGLHATTGNYQAGDLFLGTGEGTEHDYVGGTTGNLGWGFAFDLADDGTYAVYDLSPAATVLTEVVQTPNGHPSNPWRYQSGGTNVTATKGVSGTFSYVTVSDTGYKNAAGATGVRNALCFSLADIKLLGITQDIFVHFTMMCGNDALEGTIIYDTDVKEVPVPEPASMTLLGLGLAGFAVRWARRRNSR